MLKNINNSSTIAIFIIVIIFFANTRQVLSWDNDVRNNGTIGKGTPNNPEKLYIGVPVPNDFSSAHIICWASDNTGSSNCIEGNFSGGGTLKECGIGWISAKTYFHTPRQRIPVKGETQYPGCLFKNWKHDRERAVGVIIRYNY